MNTIVAPVAFLLGIPRDTPLRMEHDAVRDRT